jgi:hypothetical protein
MINSQTSINEMTEHLIDSTDHLPPVELVTSLVAQAYDRVKSITEGNVADYIPALGLFQPNKSQSLNHLLSSHLCPIAIDKKPKLLKRLSPIVWRIDKLLIA